MNDRIAPDLLSSALDVYNLEISMGGVDKEALSHAISAALLRHEQIVIDRMASVLETLADATQASGEDTDDEDGDHEAQAFGMRWAASRLRSEIPELTREKVLYTPRDGDIVEVVLGGQVSLSEEICEQCGHESASLWSLHDNRSGAEYYFDEAELKGRLNVRVLYHYED